MAADLERVEISANIYWYYGRKASTGVQVLRCIHVDEIEAYFSSDSEVMVFTTGGEEHLLTQPQFEAVRRRMSILATW